ncbi:MAG: PQQ-binding-like beta-propeller repeat protein [Bifidobacteriaceae bacterium]|nr:PQQ-binding-like beta-propeller repeat protein [Bifidobacteriaceae bacterium]
MFDPEQGLEAAAWHLRDPNLAPADLSSIVAAFPSLAASVAAHPRLDPALAARLGRLGRPEVDAVLAARLPTPPASPPAPVPPPVPLAPVPPAPSWRPDAASGWRLDAAPMPQSQFAPGSAPPAQFTPELQLLSGPAPQPQVTPGSEMQPQFTPSAPPVPSEPRNRPNRWTKRNVGWLATGLVLAVAVIVGSLVWLTPSRDDAPNGQDQSGDGSTPKTTAGPAPGPVGEVLVPSIAAPPTLGPLISTQTLLGDGFEGSSFRGFLGPNTGLAVGHNSFADEAGSGDGSGAPQADRGPLLELVGFDLDTGEAKWRIDAIALFDLNPKLGVDWQLVFWEEQAAAVLDQSFYTDNADQAAPAVLAVLNAAGEVVTQTRIASGGRVIGFHGEVVVVGDDDRMVGYPSTALDQPVWEAASPGFTRELFNPWTGTWLVAGPDGVIDARTGRVLAAGADMKEDGPDAAMYYLAEGDSDVLLRHDPKTREITRVDPESGEVLWGQGVEAKDLVMVSAVSGGTLVFDTLGRDGRVVGVDADSGAELWAKPGHSLRVLTEGGALTVANDFTDLAVLDLRTGEAVGERTLGEDDWLICAGFGVAYLGRAGNQITGLDLGSALTELWTVDVGQQLPVSAVAPILPRANGSRLFASQIAGAEDLAGGGSGADAAALHSLLVELRPGG